MKTPHAKTAAAIRQKLKEMGIKASVTSESFSMGNAVRISLNGETPETVKAVNEMAKQFQYGHYNGMEDYYDYSNRRDDIPQVKFVTVQNNSFLIAA